MKQTPFLYQTTTRARMIKRGEVVEVVVNGHEKDNGVVVEEVVEWVLYKPHRIQLPTFVGLDVGCLLRAPPLPIHPRMVDYNPVYRFQQ